MSEQPPKSDRLVAALQSAVLVLLLAGAGVAALAFFKGAPRESGLQRFGTVPAFKLTGTEGQAFDSAALSGKVWVASFVFTSCKNSCPMLTAQMKRLSQSLPAGDAYALISLSVDPDKDTPKALAAYAKAMGAEDPRWHFLTGKKAVLKELIQGGFKLVAEPGEALTDVRGHPDILHSSKLVLIDKHGAIRGYYDGLLGASADAVRRDAERLSKES
jgi:protein SCO1/2